MSNVTWSSIIDTIKSIFDNKDSVIEIYNEYYGIDFRDGNKVILSYNDIGFTAVIGYAILKDDSLELVVGYNDLKRIIPLDVHDEVESVLINGRPSSLEIDFIEILNQFLDPNYRGRERLK